MVNKGNATIYQYITIYHKNTWMAIPYGHPQQRLPAPADGQSPRRPRDPSEQHQDRRVSMAATPDDEHQTIIGRQCYGFEKIKTRHLM